MGLIQHAAVAVLVAGELPLAKRLVTLEELADYLDVASVDLCDLFEAGAGSGPPAIRIGENFYVHLDHSRIGC
jgi:hypothetical protein